MGTKITFSHVETGVNLYALIFNSAGQVADVVGSAMDTYATADLGDYDVALTELGTASRAYQFTVPSFLVAGGYSFSIHKRAGGSPAEGDLRVGVGSFCWTGSALGEMALEPATLGRTLAVESDGMAHADVKEWGGSTTPVTNITTVFDTDFAANYDATGDCWMARLAAGVDHGGDETSLTLHTISSDPVLTIESLGSGATAIVIYGHTLAMDVNGQLQFTDAIIAATISAAFTGNLSGSVGSVATGGITAASIATDAIDADAIKTDAVQEIRNAITGGAYALDTDANGRIRIVDGTGTGELNTSGGNVSADVVSVSGSATAANNMEVVFDTDFAANYDATGDCWMARLAGGVDHGGSSTTLTLEGNGVIAGLAITSPSGPAVEIQGPPTGIGLYISGQTALHLSGAVEGTQIFADLVGSVGSIDTGGIDAASFAAGAIDSGAIADNAITAAKIANGAIDAATFAADVDAEILSYLVDDATRIDASALNTASGTTIPAILDDTDLIDDGTSGLAKIATDVAAILADTGTTLDGKIDTLTTRLGAPADFGGGQSIAANLQDVVGSPTYDSSTDSLEAIRNRGDAAWATATGFSTLDASDIRDAVGLASANLDTQLASIVADTGELQTDWANGGRLDLILDSRASQTSVDDLPTNSELATALASADDAVLSAIGSLNDLSAAEVNAEVDTALADVGLTTTVTGRIDAAISTRLAAADYTAPLDAAGIRTAVGLDSANLDTQLGDLPTTAEFEARTLVAASYGTAANQVTIAGYLDTEIAAILAAVDTEVAAIKAKTDNLPASPAAVGSAMALTTGERQSVADAVLRRSITNVEANADDKHCLALLVALGTNASESGGTVTAKKPSDDTAWFTYTVTEDASAELITAIE